MTMDTVDDKLMPHGLSVDSPPRVLDLIQLHLPTFVKRIDIAAKRDQGFSNGDKASCAGGQD